MLRKLSIKARQMMRLITNNFDLVRLGANADGIKQAYANLQSEIELRRVSRGASKQFCQLSGKRHLKVHLGCGPDLRLGWINIDLTPRAPAIPREGLIFVNHDLRDGLPLPFESCALIYSSHFFEHLELNHGVRLMRDCYKALEPGGIFRIVLPDLPLLFSKYLGGDSSFFDLIEKMGVIQEGEPGSKSLIDFINYGIYQFGEHKQIYDSEKLNLTLKQIGFSSVAPSVHKDGMDPDVDLRRRYSFYTEATK